MKNPDNSRENSLEKQPSEEDDLALKVAHETLKMSKSSDVEVLRYNASRAKTRLMRLPEVVSRVRVPSPAR